MKKWYSVFVITVLAMLNSSFQIIEAQSFALGRIVFSSNRDGNYELYVMNVDGTIVQRLTNSASNETMPAWSPDGSKIAFVSDRSSKEQIYVVNADGSNEIKLSDEDAYDYDPAWSPDGSRIAFSRKTSLGSQIYLMNPDGSNQISIINDEPEKINREPDWSPDGTKLVFMSNRERSTKSNGITALDIFLMNSDGSNLHLLTRGGENAGNPDWSPDGTKIIFHSPEVERGVILIGTDGSNPIILTDSRASYPSWSVDGSKIAIKYDGHDIAVMNADGSSIINLTNSSGIIDRDPDWQSANFLIKGKDGKGQLDGTTFSP